MGSGGTPPGQLRVRRMSSILSLRTGDLVMERLSGGLDALGAAFLGVTLGGNLDPWRGGIVYLESL